MARVAPAEPKEGNVCTMWYTHIHVMYVHVMYVCIYYIHVHVHIHEASHVHVQVVHVLLELRVGGMCKEHGATGIETCSWCVNESVRESLLFSSEICWTA